MTNPYRNVGAALSFGLFSIIIFLTSLILSIRLFLDNDFSTESERVINSYFIYAYTFYNMLIGLISLFFVGEYNMLLLRIAFDRKSWYTKLKIHSYFVLIDMIAGSVISTIFLNCYLKMKNVDVFHILVSLSLIVISSYMQFFCIYLLHPDLWNIKRRREIREMIDESDNNRILIEE